MDLTATHRTTHRAGPTARRDHHSRQWLVLVGVLALLLAARAHAAPQPMYFNHIGMLQGLSQNTVMAARQDSQGFMWLGTEGGLDRWDGYSVRHYRRDSKGNGPANDFIWDIAEDNDSNLWLATDGGGIARWNRRTDRFDTWRHVATDPASLAGDKVRTLLIAPDGRVWIGTNGAGLDVFEPRTNRFRHFRHRPDTADSLPSDAVFALYLDRSGALWVGTDAGLARMDPVSGALRIWRHDDRVPGSLCGNEVRSIRERANGELWVGTFGSGVCRFDAATEAFTTFRRDARVPGSLSDDDVRAIYEDDEHRLWIGTANGLNLFIDLTRQFAHATADGSADSLSDNYIMSLYQDRGGVLWVGTRSAGVNTWNPRSWSFGHYQPAWSRNTNITSFAATPGSIWVGTMGHGLTRQFDDERRPPVVYDTRQAHGGPALPDDRVMSLWGERDGSVWVGTMTGGLVHLRPDQPVAGETFRHQPENQDSLSADGVMALLVDRNGNLWIGTYGGGVSMRAAGEHKFRRYRAGGGMHGLSSANATAIIEDRDGGIWIGTDAGLDLLDPASGSIHHFVHTLADAASLAANSIYALHVDNQGSVWIGTAGGGMSRVRGTSRDPGAIRFQTIAQAQGLASDIVYGIESDARGTLWISGNNGISHYTPATGDVQTFHRSHGLQAEEFNYGAHFRGPDGRLWFGGANGYNAFVPAYLRRNLRQPPVVLTRFEKFDRLAVTAVPHPLLQAAHLAAGESMFTFEFAALDFTAPAKNRYAYFLEGFDSGWIDAGQGHRATYTNLDPGHYRFRVKAANSEGAWNNTGLAINVDVDAPWWRTLLAYLLYTAIGLLLAGLLLRAVHARQRMKAAYLAQLEAQVQARTAELKERNEELRHLADAKGEFVARMSHELRTPITGVLGMVELLLRTLLDAKQTRLASTIKRSANSLLGIINDILDFSKIEASRVTLEQIPLDLEQLADESVEALAVVAQGKGLELICDTPSAGLPVLLGDPLRLRQILANLLGNALKFTERGEVVLRVKVMAADAAAATVCIEVSDTGTGIHPGNLRRIFESFAQEDGTTTRRFGGTGLGLSITRQLVELMGGTIEAHSAPGAGATFRVTLTLPHSSAAMAGPSAAAVTAPIDAHPALFGRSVLLVAATDALSELTCRHLRHAGVRLTMAGTGDVAHAQRQATRDIDVVLVICRSVADRELAARLAARSRHGAVLLETLATGAATAQPRSVTVFRPTPRVALLGALRRLLAGAEPTTSPPAEGPLRGHVLVVEDNFINQEVTVGMLEVLGVTATVAASGEAAVACARTSHFDLVLMDCGLPGMNGYDTTAAIRALPEVGPLLPVLAFTANNTELERQRCLAAGMNDVLLKPCELQALGESLRRWLPTQEEPAPDDVSGTGTAAAHR